MTLEAFYSRGYQNGRKFTVAYVGLIQVEIAGWDVPAALDALLAKLDTLRESVLALRMEYTDAEGV